MMIESTTQVSRMLAVAGLAIRTTVYAFCCVLFLSACTIQTVAKRDTASTFNAQLGAQYLARGNLELADEKIRKALEQNSSNALAHITMAQLQFAIDRPNVARKHFKRAMTLEPDNPENRNSYGIFLCRTGEVARAEEEFNKVASNPYYKTPEYALDNAGICMMEVGRIRDAERYFM